MPQEREGEPGTSGRPGSAQGQGEGQEQTLRAILRVLESIREEARVSSAETHALLSDLLAASEGGLDSAQLVADIPTLEEVVATAETRLTRETPSRVDEPEDPGAAEILEERALTRLRQLAVQAGLDTDNDAFHRKSCGQMVWPWKGGEDGGPALCPVCHLPNGGFLETDGARRKALELMAEDDRQEGTQQVPMGSIGRWVEERRGTLGL